MQDPQASSNATPETCASQGIPANGHRASVDVLALGIGTAVGIGTILSLAAFSYHAAVTPEASHAPLAAGSILGIGCAAALVSCYAAMFMRHRVRSSALRRRS